MKTMVNILSLNLMIAALLLSGCATNKPDVVLNKAYWDKPKHSPVKVALAKEHKPALAKLGSQGLLDMAVNEIATSKFGKHLKQYSLSNFNKIHTEFVHKLNQAGIHAERYTGPAIDVNKLAKFKTKDYAHYANKNYQPLAVKLKNNQLLLVQLSFSGAERHYYGFLPLDKPVPTVKAIGRLIDTKTNKILWRYTVKRTVAVQGKWDQPPNYPNVDIALKSALKTVKNELITNFFYQKPGKGTKKKVA